VGVGVYFNTLGTAQNTTTRVSICYFDINEPSPAPNDQARVVWAPHSAAWIVFSVRFFAVAAVRTHVLVLAVVVVAAAAVCCCSDLIAVVVVALCTKSDR
jgi:hypothetical protein